MAKDLKSYQARVSITAQDACGLSAGVSRSLLREENVFRNFGSSYSRRASVPSLKSVKKSSGFHPLRGGMFIDRAHVSFFTPG